MNKVPVIQVWQFDDAPDEYKNLFSCDDADWLALVPVEFKDAYIGWLECSEFGCCKIRQEVLQDGSTIRVGYHS